MDSPHGLINDSGNPGKSVVIRPAAGTITSPASLALVPAPSGSPVEEATLVSLSTEDDKSEVVTVTLDNPNPFSVPTDQLLFPARALARATAKVEWGVNGVQSTAFIDFDHGLSFSVPTSYLRITGINELLPPNIANLAGTGPAVLGRNVRLGAFCGYGSAAGTKNASAKKTLYYDNVGQFGAPARAKIPPFATNLIVQFVPTVAPAILTIYDEAGVGIVQYSIPITPIEPIELSGDAAFVDLVIVGLTSVRYIFGLSF